MANTKKKKVKTSQVSKATNQGIYGMNANKSSIKKRSTYAPGSELTGTIK